jgi:hypothetical protein
MPLLGAVRAWAEGHRVHAPVAVLACRLEVPVEVAVVAVDLAAAEGDGGHLDLVVVELSSGPAVGQTEVW